MHLWFEVLTRNRCLPETGLRIAALTVVPFLLMQVLAYEANIEAAVLAQDSGAMPLPEDYTQFIPKVPRMACYCCS